VPPCCGYAPAPGNLSIDIDELFSQFDASNDGAIDQEETAALARPPPHGANPEQLFAELDANADCSIDQDELSSRLGATRSSATHADQTAYANLVSALLKQYEAGAGYSSSLGNRLSLSA